MGNPRQIPQLAAPASIQIHHQKLVHFSRLMPSEHELYDEAEKLKIEGKLEEAAAKLHAALEQNPQYALAHSNLAVIYGRLQKHEEAIKHGEKVCELEPQDPFSFTAMSVTYQRAGKIQEAEDALARARMMEQS